MSEDVINMRNKVNKKSFGSLEKVVLCLFLAGYAVLSYWMFWPYKPLTFHEPIEILNEDKTVAPGGYLVYRQHFTKHIDAQALIRKQLMNHYVITMAPIIGNVPTGERDMRVKIRIPDGAEPGDYVLLWEADYKVNPIRRVTVSTQSEQFCVKKCESE